MGKNNSTFTLTVLAAAMAASGVAQADDKADDSAELNSIIKPSSIFSVGIGTWSGDRQNLGINDGMRDKGAYLLFDADINTRDDVTGTWKSLLIRNLGLDTREIRAEYLEQGKQGIFLEYSKFKHDLPYTINTNQVGIGTTSQTTGTNIPNTAIGSGTNYQFGVERDKYGAGVYKNLIPGVDLKVNFSTEEKEGNRITSNGSALFVADLIDWTTNQLEATLSYTGDNLQLMGGYNGSWFKNANSMVTLYNANGSVNARMTQPLDNQAHQGFLSGAYRFSATTQGNFKVAYTHATQNENLPTSGISSNAYGYLPNLQGEVNTTLVQLGLASKPIPKLALVANLRYYDSKDKTPQYGSVRLTDNSGNIALNTTPLSYTTTSGKLEANYDLTRGYNLIAGVDYSSQDRTAYTTIAGVAYQAYVPYRSKLDEATYRVQLRKSLSETLNGSLAYLYSDRGGSDMTTSTQQSGSVNLVSPVHIADRKRQKVRLALDWAPSEQLGIQLNLEKAQDEYGTRARSHGTHEGNADLYSIDVSYQINDKWQATGWYSYNLTETQLVNYNSATIQKIGQQEDTGNAVGLNLTGAFNAKTKVGADISWSRDKSNFAQSYSNGSALAQVPDITSEVTRIKLFADYALEKNASLRFEVIHERWKTDDWQWTYSTGLPWQFGTASDGTTVLTDPKQNSTLLGVRYTYKF